MRTLLAALLALGALVPARASAQAPSHPAAAIYLGALDFLRSLEPSAIRDDLVCEEWWREYDGIPVRCPAERKRAGVFELAEALDVPLVEEATCDRTADPPGTVDLALSPVQLVDEETAWFLVETSCRKEGNRAYIRRDFVDMRATPEGWVVVETRLLGIT